MASYRRFESVKRDYSPEEVEKLKGSFSPDCNIARFGAERLWSLIQRGGNSYIQAMGAMTGRSKNFLFYYTVPLVQSIQNMGISLRISTADHTCKTW